jgi:hypothetical protein
LHTPSAASQYVGTPIAFEASPQSNGHERQSAMPSIRSQCVGTPATQTTPNVDSVQGGPQ